MRQHQVRCDGRDAWAAFHLLPVTENVSGVLVSSRPESRLPELAWGFPGHTLRHPPSWSPPHVAAAAFKASGVEGGKWGGLTCESRSLITTGRLEMRPPEGQGLFCAGGNLQASRGQREPHFPAFSSASCHKVRGEAGRCRVRSQEAEAPSFPVFGQVNPLRTPLPTCETGAIFPVHSS